MKYRVRNIRTGVCVYPEETYAEDSGEPTAEWVLECEANGDWITSGFHVRDLLGVKDPRTFAEAFAVLQGAS